MSFYPKKINRVDIGILMKVRRNLHDGQNVLLKAMDRLLYIHGNTSVGEVLCDNKQTNVLRRAEILGKKIGDIAEELIMLEDQIVDVLEENKAR